MASTNRTAWPLAGLVIIATLMAATCQAGTVAEYTRWKKAEIAGEIRTVREQALALKDDKSISATERRKRADSLKARIRVLEKTDCKPRELGHMAECGIGTLIKPKATVKEVLGPEDAVLDLEFTISRKPIPGDTRPGATHLYVRGGDRIKLAVFLHGEDTASMAPGVAITLPTVIVVTKGSKYIIQRWEAPAALPTVD